MIPMPGTLSICTSTKVVAATCEHIDFGIEYKSCRHKEHGVESYNVKESSNCPVNQFNNRFNAKCPSYTDMFSAYSTSINDLIQENEDTSKVPAKLSPYIGLGSSCSTCDDLGVETKEERQKKFACLQQSILNGEEEAEGFGLTTLRESIAAAKELFKISQEKDSAEESSLTEEQRDYVLYDLNSMYPAVRYDNPEFFPDSFKIKINFSPRRGTNIEGYTKDYGSQYRRKVHVVYGWKSVSDSTSLDVSDRAVEMEGTDTLPVDLQPLNSYVSFGHEIDIKWEIKLPNGNYKVSVGVTAGDFKSGDSTIINAEGTQVLKFVPNRLVTFSTGELKIGVTDGNLSIDGIGSKNGKISYLTIESI